MDCAPELKQTGFSVPVLWRYEVSAVLAKSQKDGILTALKADEFLASLNKLNIVVDPTVPIAS